MSPPPQKNAVEFAAAVLTLLRLPELQTEDSDPEHNSLTSRSKTLHESLITEGVVQQTAHSASAKEPVEIQQRRWRSGRDGFDCADDDDTHHRHGIVRAGAEPLPALVACL